MFLINVCSFEVNCISVIILTEKINLVMLLMLGVMCKANYSVKFGII